MEIRSESRISHPRERVFAAYRDRLPEIARYIPDVKEVRVLSRAEEGDVVRLHNEWVGDREIPAVASAILKPEHLRWDDFAAWDASSFVCDWRLQTRAFTSAVRCAGRNTFLTDGAGTRVVLTGLLQIDVKEIPGVPSFLAKRIAPSLESFIVSLITPNLERVNQSLQRFLDEAGA